MGGQDYGQVPHPAEDILLVEITDDKKQAVVCSAGIRRGGDGCLRLVEGAEKDGVRAALLACFIDFFNEAETVLPDQRDAVTVIFRFPRPERIPDAVVQHTLYDGPVGGQV